MLNQKENWHPSTGQDLEKKLREQLDHILDVEHKEELLRQFKLTHWLMAARAELYGLSTSVRIGKFLAELAEVIVKQVFEIASGQLEERYPGIQFIKSRFVISPISCKLGAKMYASSNIVRS